MGLYDRDYYKGEEQYGARLSSPKSACVTLIIINVAIYFLDALFMGERLRPALSVSSEAVLNPLKWYQFLTAGFAHAPDIQHVLWNMVGLFLFGREVEHALGKKKFTWFYLTAILLGNIGFALRSLAMGSDQHVIGASGAVTAVIILFALKFPRRTILFMFAIPMPAWVLGVIIVVMDVLHSFGNDLVAHDVHLIGALYGWLFYKYGWSLETLVPSSLNFKAAKLKPKPKVRLYNPEAKYEKLDRQADELLEKVHRDGADSLTAKERQILEDYSRRMQQKHR